MPPSFLTYRHLADYLSTSKEDVVLLQEVWVDADAQLLISAGKAAGLVHATHFRCVLGLTGGRCGGCCEGRFIALQRQTHMLNNSNSWGLVHKQKMS